MDDTVLKRRALRRARRESLAHLGGSPIIPAPVVDDEVTPPQFLGHVARPVERIEIREAKKKAPSKRQMIAALTVLLAGLIHYLQSIF